VQHGKSVRNMGKNVRNMEKVFATRCLDVGRNMLATSSQHVCHKLVTSLATCTLCHGRREEAEHGKNVHNMGKGIRNMEKGVRNMGKGVRNIEKCSQHEKRCSQHSQHASQHHDPTADMVPILNRVAEKVSDPSVRIGHPCMTLLTARGLTARPRPSSRAEVRVPPRRGEK
jgi:hypothetical protein